MIDMRAVVQRVSQSAVRVGDKTIGQIQQGLVILIGIRNDDDDSHA